MPRKSPETEQVRNDDLRARLARWQAAAAKLRDEKHAAPTESRDPCAVVYRVGQAWDRDGGRRIILQIQSGDGRTLLESIRHGDQYQIYWDDVTRNRSPCQAYCTGWEEWAAHATLVDRHDGDG